MKAGYSFPFTLFSPTLSFSITKFVEWFAQSITNVHAAWTGPCRTLYDNYVNEGQGQCGPVLECPVEHDTSELRKTTVAGA